MRRTGFEPSPLLIGLVLASEYKISYQNKGDGVMRKNSLVFLTVYLFILSITLGGCATMQDKEVTTTNKYPDKPITLIVPFGVGGGMDLVARLLEKSAPAYLGQPLVILNKPGASGALGWNELVSATPDGYTIGMASTEVILHPLYGAAKYNYPTALDPLIQISESPQVMAVRADKPWQNVNDLIIYARQHPGQLKFGHAGIGGIAHIAGESFAKNANIVLQQVPFQSGAEEAANLLGGHVEIIFINPAAIKEHVKSGALKVLAVPGDHRLIDPVFANVPTFKEQNVNIIGSGWYDIAAPKELPIEIKNKLADGLKLMINDPDFKINLENLGLEVNYLDPKETTEKWLDDNDELTRTIQETGILNTIKDQKK
jgi:tripartite-type tricarboxylate transporter receptor subunit TctC